MKNFLFLMAIMLASILPVGAADNVTFYIIGSNVNGQSWALAQPDAAFEPLGNGLYRWEGKTLGTGFKVNNGSWSNDDYNFGSYSGKEISMNVPYSYYVGSNSGNIAFNGFVTIENPVVELDINLGTITLKNGSSGGTANWYIPGLNGIDELSDATRLDPVSGLNGRFSRKFEVTEETGSFKISDDGWAHQYGTNYPDIYYIDSNNLSSSLVPVVSVSGDMPYSLSKGTYEVMFDLNNPMVKFTPVDVNVTDISLYVIGEDVNGHNWVLAQEDCKMTMISPGVYEWNGKTLASGFKINDGTWNSPQLNIGAGNYNFEKISLNKPYYYFTGNDSKDILFDGFNYVINPKVTVDLNAGTIFLTGSLTEESGEYYIIGKNVNGKEWILAQEDAKFIKESDDIYRWSGEILESQFKINDGTWSNDNYNFGTYGKKISFNTPFYYETGGSTLNIEFDGFDTLINPVVELDIRRGTITLVEGTKSGDGSGGGGEAPGSYDFGNLYIIGDNINGHNWTLSEPSSKFEYKGDGIYEWRGNYLGNGFKINDGTWSGRTVNGLVMDIGTDGMDTGVYVGVPYKFYAGSGSQNIGFAEVPEVINPFVSLNMKEKTLTVKMDGNTLQVNLPADGSSYKNCILEVTETTTGTRHRYVVTDRLVYTFQGLRSDGDYTLRLLTPSEIELAREDHFTMHGEDIEFEFDNILRLHTVNAVVLTEDGKDVTEETEIEWYQTGKDGNNTYIRKASSIGEMPEGIELLCKINLNSKLGASYHSPEDQVLVVKDKDNLITITLQSYTEIEICGSIVDSYSSPIKNANITVTQTLGGKYYKTNTTKTDSKGQWAIKVFDSPETLLTLSAQDFVSLEKQLGILNTENGKIDLGKITLEEIKGLTITYGFTYKDPADEKIQDFYSDYKNVDITVFNLTTNRVQERVSLQYPILAVLDPSLRSGDKLRLTAVSKTGMFNPVENIITVDTTLKASTTFALSGKGGIEASFETTENPSVVGMLYTSKGEFLKKQNYSNATARFEHLDDGEYTLISMGNTNLLSSISRLSNLNELGLKEGVDFVSNRVKVESGKIAEVNNIFVPAIDESLFYFTDNSSGFSSNKTVLTSGNYLTLRSNIEFKSVYKNNINNVNLIVDLPEGCELIEQSVIKGSNLLPYSISGNRLIIPLGIDYNQQTRFCVIPTFSGQMPISASLAFDYKGKSVTQPLGNTIIQVKDIDINVPSVVRDSKFCISGITLASSDVKIFVDGTLAGTTKSNAVGSWTTECQISNPYNLSYHEVYAEITNPSGITLKSETKQMVYDISAIEVSKVTMYHWNPEMQKNYTVVFDFLNPSTSPTPWTLYYPNKVFTYTIEFTENDPERVSNVVLYVHTADEKFVPVQATFDKAKGLWYAEINMGSQSDSYYPVNCSIDFNFVSSSKMDEFEYNNSINSIMISYEEVQTLEEELNLISNQLENLIEDDNITPEEISSLLRESRLLSGANYDISSLPLDDLTEEELIEYFNKLSLDIELLLNQDKLNVFDKAFSVTLNEVLSTIDGVSISTCEGISPKSLEDLGYIEINKTDSESIYILATETVYNIIDFSNNYYISIDLTADSKIARFVKSQAKEDDVLGIMNDYIQKTKNFWAEISSSFIQIANLVEDVIMKVAEKKAANVLELSKVDYAIEWLKKQPFKDKKRWKEQRIKWLEQRNSLNKNIAQNSKILDWLNKNFSPNGLRIGRIGGGIFALVDVGLVINEAISNFNSVISIYNSVPDPCEDDYVAAINLRNRIKNTGIGAGIYYTAQLASDVIQIASLFGGVSAIIPSGGTSLGLIAGSVGLAVVSFAACKVYAYVFEDRMQSHYNDALALKCLRRCGEEGQPRCPDPYPTPTNSGGGGSHGSGNPNSNAQIDPSGYVYEAVPSNRVEGVQATIYYKETKENMYGETYEEVVLWNAEEYAQKNPLFTDENGMYRWDVPQGLWQVKFEKDGYITAFSEWLPVPPPQLDVNIPIVQNSQPEVISAHAFDNAVEVAFNKYMEPSSLSSTTIHVIANGKELPGEIILMNETPADEFSSEEDPNAVTYASRVRLQFEEPLSLNTDEVLLNISKNVMSYAGVPMRENFIQYLDIEKEVLAIDADDIKVKYGEIKELAIHAMPADAVAGKTVRIINSSDLIVTIDRDEVTLDAEGNAIIKVKGELPGVAHLTFDIDGVDIKGESTINVVTQILSAEAPRASRASGTTVYRGSKITLTTDSEEGVIYYTLDGSCPCDENGTRRKYTVPLVINEETHILAVTVVDNGGQELSDISEFNYSLIRGDIDYNLSKGWTWISHPFESPLDVNVLMDNSNIMRVRGSNGETLRGQDSVSGTLETLDPREGYKVETTAATTLDRLSNYAWNPAFSISLAAGANWIGYPMTQTMSVDEAFALSDPEMGDAVIGQTGFAQFDGENWIGTLATLSPGQGYVYYSVSPKDIYYNNTIVSNARARFAGRRNAVSAEYPDVHKYPDIMPMVAEILVNFATSNDTYTVYAYCGDECRGAARSLGNLEFMNVYGNHGDKIRLVVIDTYGKELLTKDVDLSAEKLLGDIFNPIPLDLNNTAEINNPVYEGQPVVSILGESLIITGCEAGSVESVEIYDLDGRCLLRIDDPASNEIRINTLLTSVYLTRLKKNGEIFSQKLIVK